MQTPIKLLLADKGNIVHNIDPHASIYECVIKLTKLEIGALVVLDGQKVIGIISERDIIQKVLSSKTDPTKARVQDIMSSEVFSISPSTTMQEAMEFITTRRIRHLPVLENGKLQGLVSIGDLTKWVITQQANEISALTGYIHGDPKN